MQLNWCAYPFAVVLHKLTEPDLSTMHNCKNMDNLLDWNKKNAACVEVEKIRWIALVDAVKLSLPP
jgi:hypothetical protein